jgi:autotransporter-associated beta strand protein
VDGLNSAGSIGTGRNHPFVDLSSYTLTLNPAANSTITITNSAVQGTGSLIVTGAGKAVLAASNTLSGQVLVQSGTLALVGAGSLNNAEHFDVSSGALLDVSRVNLSLKAGQTIAGDGTVAGPVTVLSNATLNPGADRFGILTITSNLTLQGSVQIRVSLDGGTTNNNCVTGANTINYGGTLVVSNIGLTALAAGNSFNLFHAASATGKFATISPDPGPGLKWNFNTTNGVLSVVRPSTPVLKSLMLLGTSLVCTFSNSTGGVAYSCRSSTNLQLPRNLWSLVQTGSFDESGKLTLTNILNETLGRRFFFITMP